MGPACLCLWAVVGFRLGMAGATKWKLSSLDCGEIISSLLRAT